MAPTDALSVGESLALLNHLATRFESAGLVASHNDICNDTGLLTDDGRWSMIDRETLALDDPARDIGALLWWYYPPEQRARCLTATGYADDPSCPLRMQALMAMHCRQIILPRRDSLATFQPASFTTARADVRAVVAGEENPQGYD